MKVLIWVDPHKASVASAVVDEALGELLERASRRTATAPGCSRRSPGDGGDRKMMSFLADLHSRREFGPFTSADFIDDVVAAQDAIDRDKLERWLLSPPAGVPPTTIAESQGAELPAPRPP